ncbi:hypothetical protein V1509DRAFT_630534 [Lipomyces kononenkoae]
MDNPSYEELLRRQHEEQQLQEHHQPELQQQPVQQQPQQQHHQQLPPLYSTSISGYLPQHTIPEPQMRRDGENYMSDTPFQSYFGPYNGSSTTTAAPTGEPYAAYTAQTSSHLYGLRPQMNQNVSITQNPPTQYSFMPPATPALYQAQPQSRSPSHLVASNPMTSSPSQHPQTSLSSQPPQQNYPPPQLQLDQTQFYGELNGVGQQQYAPVPPYQQPQIRTPYFASFLNGEQAPQYLNSQTYNTYGDFSGTGQDNVASEGMPRDVHNVGIGALSSTFPADVSVSGVGNTDYRPVPHWPVPPMTASTVSEPPGALKSEKKVTKRTAPAMSDAPIPKKKATKKTTTPGSAAALTSSTIAQLPTVPTALNSTIGLVAQSPLQTGQNLAASSTPQISLPQVELPSVISGAPPVPEKPKELPILQEKDPVTALRLRVATAFRNLMDDTRLLADRLVEIMLSIPEEAYGTTTGFDLREVYLSQLTALTGSTKDVWIALAESNLCLARIRNWLVYDYKSMRFDSAKPVLVALSTMPISTEQLKRVKMEKVLVFFEGKGNDACKALARKVRSRAKNVGDKDTLSEKPGSPRQEIESGDSKTGSNGKKAQIPRTNPLSGFTIPKRSHAISSSTTAKVPTSNTTSNTVKAERPSGNTSFFQSLQKKAATPAKPAAPKPAEKPAEDKKSVSSAQSSTPAPAAVQPRFSSLYTAFITGPKSEEVSENSTPEPVRPRKQRKTVAWRSDADLVQVRYFELDPSERALNVSDTVHERYRSARELDISEGRAAFKKGNHIEDIEYEVEEDEKILWYNPTGIDFVKCERFGARELDKNVIRRGGSKVPESPETVIQKERESNVLLAMYFTDADIPASPSEPDKETDMGSDDSPAVKEIPVPQHTRLSWTLLGSNGISLNATTVSSTPSSSTVAAPIQSTQSSTAQGFATLQALLPFLAQAQAQTQSTRTQVPLSQPQQPVPDLTALAAMLQAAGGFYGTGKAAANGSAS